MHKNSPKQYPKRKKPDEIACIIADIYGVNPRYVRMVRDGERNNEEILTAYIEYQQGKNKLIKSIKELVPFDN